jgi:hypothetical protein
MVAMARQAFGEYWLADVTRLVMCFISLVLVMVCIKVAWMRARSPKNSPRRDTSPWALISYGSFAFIPTVLGFRGLGGPLDPLLAMMFAVALVSGVVALFGQVSIRLLKRADAPPRGPEDTADE